MKHLFSQEGRSALSAVMKRQPLLAFDFDGTLAPIVQHWDDARIPDVIAQRLQKLNRRLPMAVLSGRCVADIRERLCLPDCQVMGSHGAEDPDDPLPAHLTVELQRLRQRLECDQRWLQGEGILLEDKGVSLSLHYRLAADPQRARAILNTLLADFGPLSVFGGKFVVNILPDGAGDKGTALQKVLARTGREVAIFFGDDVNDEPAFASAGPDWVTVRIGRETDVTAARFFLSDIHEMAEAMDILLACDTRPKDPPQG